jgi:hypothetical protein
MEKREIMTDPSWCDSQTTQEAISEAIDYYKNYYERENGITKEIAEIINS